jgi:hypothetical protein
MSKCKSSAIVHLLGKSLAAAGNDKFRRNLKYMNRWNLDHEEIERLAYRLWQERGRPYGSSQDDWFLALELLRRRDSAEGPPFSSVAMEPTEE